MSLEKVKVVKKICILGDPSVGKTSLIRKFVYNMFDDKYLITLGAKVTKKVIDIQKDNKDFEIKLMIWDIAGQKTFGSIKSAYYRGSEGAIVVCDLTRKDTLINLENWISSLFNITKNIPIVILANKNDLIEKAQFDNEEMKKIAVPHNAPYFFTSANTGENVENSFQELGQRLVDNM